MGQKQMLLRTGFTKGVKPSLDPSIVPPDALWKGQNIRPNEAGVLRIRTGCRPTFESLGSGCIQGMLSTPDKIYFVHQGQLHSSTDTFGDVAQINGLNLENKERSVDLIHWTDKGTPCIFLVTGEGFYKHTTDTDQVNLITPYEPNENETPNLLKDTDAIGKCSVGLVRPSISQRFALTGNPDAPNEVYFSAPMNPAYFPSDQVLKLPDDGGEIIGLAVWYNALLIFRDKDIYAFFGTDMQDPEAQLVLQNNAVGCIARKSMQTIPEYGIIFLGNDNVYLMTGVTGLENQLTLKPIADDVINTLEKALSKGGKQNICSAWHSNTYILTIPFSRTSTFKWRKGAWFVDTGPFVSDYVKFKNKLYGGSNFTGDILEFNSNDLMDAEDAYRMHVITRREMFNPSPVRITRFYLYVLSGYRVKDIEEYYFGDILNTLMYNEGIYKTSDLQVGTDQNLEISLMVDGKRYTVDKFRILVRPLDSTSTEVEMPLQIYEARFNPVIKGHSVQVKIETRTPGEDIAILGYGMEYFARKSLDDKDKSRKAISFIGGSNVK